MLIALEGIDNCGKTTQALQLQAALNAKGQQSCIIHFRQRDTAIGQIIHRHLTKDEIQHPKVIQLLFSADRWSARDKIYRCLKQGMHVLLVRYVPSGTCYSAATNGNLPCENMTNERGLWKPDLVFYFDGTPSVKRYYAREYYEVDTFQQKVKKMFALQFDDTYVIVAAKQNRHYITGYLCAAISKKMTDLIFRNILNIYE